MPNILYLDVWDKGYRNFTRINPFIKKLGVDTILVHTGSFNEKLEYTEKIIDDLVVRDIKYYKTYFFKTVIKKEQPKIIIILNLSFIIDRAIVNIAKDKNIKIIYLAHGKLFDVNISNIRKTEKNEELKGNMTSFFKKKNVLYLINYLSSIKWYNILRAFFKIIIGLYKNPADFLYFANYNKELDADRILLYGQADKELLEYKGFPSDKIKVIGNPEISLFMNSDLKDKTTLLCELGKTSTFEYAVYLEDGLVQANLVSTNEWYEHLAELKRIFKNKGISLIVKLHPRTNIKDHLPFFDKENIIVVEDINFKDLLTHAKIVVSMFSSTILYALLLHKKVLIPCWGKMEEVMIKNFPENVVSYCFSKEQFIDNIDNSITQADIDNIDQYTEYNHIDSIKLIAEEVNNFLKY